MNGIPTQQFVMMIEVIAHCSLDQPFYRSNADRRKQDVDQTAVGLEHKFKDQRRDRHGDHPNHKEQPAHRLGNFEFLIKEYGKQKRPRTNWIKIHQNVKTKVCHMTFPRIPSRNREI